MARRASSRREVLHIDFLTPPILNESIIVLGKLADIKAMAQGGYPQAERCRFSVGHPQAFTTDPNIVAALSITGNFGFHPYSHGDFLCTILGTWIARKKLGDIILQSVSGAKIHNGPKITEWLTQTAVKILIRCGNFTVIWRGLTMLVLHSRLRSGLSLSQLPLTLYYTFCTVLSLDFCCTVFSLGFFVSFSLILSRAGRLTWRLLESLGGTFCPLDLHFCSLLL
ncbi:hypothetical protein LOK49_LG10G01563, partial [Camellia lanceoleosa]